MSIYKKFKTSEEHEQRGVWLDYGDGERVKIARAGGSNKKFLRAAEKFRRKYRRQLDLDVLPLELQNAAAREIYADCVVLDWEGFTDENDQPLACTRENVVKVFTDLPDLFTDVQQQALNVALFREVIDEEDAKN